ncbi:tetratricopeptide repeat protein [Constrictibacter sp. MBR-5]|jgi:tetratricopeptide (TPR) repeat protein|uniref:tetratricopeptide repeat protein n=1 Tax=Constrictibacter sp. MBR-5 TaxID=3156467 RepID=UPI0033918061
MRAFLSHSARDKGLVEPVAKELGRQYCLYDTYAFQTGEDFRASIRDGLSRSDTLVLFASKSSLDSMWVKFELDEAELLRVDGKIKRSIVFIIDNVVRYSDLPEWLQRGRVKQLNSPKAIANEIRFHINDQIRLHQQPIFVGRSAELNEAQRAIVPIDGSLPARAFLLYGLSGIGRKTLASRIASDTLSLPKITPVRLEEGDSAAELAVKLAEYIEQYSNADELRRMVSLITNEEISELESRIVRYLQLITQNGDMTIIVDDGGLLDNDGFIEKSIQSIINKFGAAPDVYCCFVTNRRPAFAPTDALSHLPCVRVNPLSLDDIKRLITLVASRRNVQLRPDQVAELATFMRGYPPAVQYAMELIYRRGADLVLNTKVALVEFSASYFLRILSDDAELSPVRRSILSTLASYSPLPLRTLGSVFDLEPIDLDNAMSYLLDCAFVYPDEDGFYCIAEPLIDAVNRMTSLFSIDHLAVANAIRDTLDDLEEEAKKLALSRSLYRALSLSGKNSEGTDAVHLVSDNIQVAMEFYHARDYDNSIKFGLMSVEQRPNNIEARSYLIRALVQNEEYDVAEAQIQQLRGRGDLKESYFLTGFLNRKRGRYQEAIKAYGEAVKRGRKGAAVHRELALCFLEVGDLPKAREHIDQAQERDRDNRYVVDLQVQIAVRQKDEETARSRLATLEAVDRREFYLHRLSTVEYAFGNFEASYAAAEGAIAASNQPTVAMLANLIKAQIATKRLEEALRNIDVLDNSFSKTHHDIRVGLRCKWETAAGNYGDALATWGKLRDKDQPVHKALRYNVLLAMLEQMSPLESLRSDLDEEFKILSIQLKNYNIDDFDLMIADPR